MNTNSFEANELRKKGEFEKAIGIYRELLNADSDSYIIAGFLHCLRKTKQFPEAFDICKLIEEKHSASDWCKNEAIWTIIQGALEREMDPPSFDEIFYYANLAMKFGPEESKTQWRIIRAVLKSAKQRNRWEIVKVWVGKITPEVLSTEPMKDEKGREGWCEQSVWYNYKIRAMIEVGDKEEAIRISNRASELFPRQSRFFRRLIALSTLRLSRLQDAEKLYSDLANVPRPDWWVLQEYALVLKEMGKNEIALKWMCQAAILNQKLESLVSLFQEIGDQCNLLQNNVQALNHFLLCKYVREENGWSIPHAVENALHTLSFQSNVPQNLKETLTACKLFWNATLGISSQPNQTQYRKRQIKHAVFGRVALGMAERPFCFINSDRDFAAFCFKTDLPKETCDGETVVFDAIPSFDKKKKKEAWKAVNIRKT